MNIYCIKRQRLSSVVFCLAMVLSMLMGMICIAWADETDLGRSETTGELGSDNQGSAKVESDGQKVVKSFTINGDGRSETINASSKASYGALDSSGGGGGGSTTQPTTDPQMVLTTVESVYGIISSDKYFGNAFYLQFTGLEEAGDYTVVLTGEGLGDNGLTGEIVGNSKDSNWNVEEPVRGVLFDIPESAIVYGTSRAFYVQVRDGENRELFSAPVEITTKFIRDVEVSGQDHYGKNARVFILNAKIPVYIDDGTKLHAYLINSEGKIVAADVQDYLDYVQIYWTSNSKKVDPRYHDVFGDFGAYDAGSPERTIGRNWTDIYPIVLLKTDTIPAGPYNLQIVAEDASGQKETYTVAQAITVVDAPIIDYIDPEPSEYTPASVGSNLFYIEVSFTGAGKDDLDIVVKDEDGRIMARPVASKYSWAYEDYCSSVYKMQLQSGIVFEADQEYHIEITRKDQGEIYYDGDGASLVYPIGYLKIYRHVFNNGLDADFTLKAVNADGTSYRLRLRDDIYDVYLSEAVVTPASGTFSVKFYDEDDYIIQLKPACEYAIEVEAVDGVVLPYINEYSFDTYSDEYIPSIITDDMKTYLEEAATSLPFDFYISTDVFNIDADGQFAVAFYPDSGEGITVEGDAVTATLVKKNFGEEGSQLEKDYVRLTGVIPINGPLQEGAGLIKLRYTARDNEVDTAELFYIRVIKPDKVYADYIGTNGFGYPVFRVWLELLKNFTFDDSKFTILIKDLLGEERVKGSLILNWGEQHPSSSIVYKDFMIKAPDNLPQGYYIVSVKYDGKDIYDTWNPTQLAFRGWSTLALIDARPGIVSYWFDDNHRLIGIEVSGAKADSKITAVLYDRSDKDNFDPIKTVTLVKGDEKNVYYYTEQALQGVDLTKSYEIAYFCDNLIMEVNDSEINAATTPDDGGNGGGGGGSGGGGGPNTVNSTTGKASVSPGAGGKVGLGSDVSVNIPASALKGTARVEVTIQKVSDPPPAPSGFKLLGAVYEFKVGGDAGYSFNKPVTITFTFDPDALADGETPAVYYYDEATGQWVDLGGTISGNTITVTVDHFTKFTVLAREATPSPEEPVPVSDQLFSDVPASFWASQSIYELHGLGVVSGYPDGTFRPDGNITRAEFAVILVKAYKLPLTGANVFDDTAGHWARDYISAAYAAGVVSGYSESSFGPNDLITREQMAVMTGKAAGIEAATPEITFTDNDEISAWAREALAAVVQNGIMQGYPEGAFYPQRNATRAETVTVMVNALR